MEINGDSIFGRTALLLGAEAVNAFARLRVAVFGVGGVGGWCAESLVRSGVGHLTIVDSDSVCDSNVNRQVMATSRTIGQKKVDALRERLLEINPAAEVVAEARKYSAETAATFDLDGYDYVVDAIDTVSGKLALVQQARDAQVPIICSMGTGNKLDPAAFEVADIYETSVCPLARVMRTQCRKRGIDRLKVVYSKEPPQRVTVTEPDGVRRAIPASIAFVPAAAGMVLAGAVVTDLLQR